MGVIKITEIMSKKGQAYSAYREIYHPDLEVYWDVKLEQFIDAIDNIYSDEWNEHLQRMDLINFLNWFFDNESEEDCVSSKEYVDVYLSLPNQQK